MSKINFATPRWFADSFSILWKLALLAEKIIPLKIGGGGEKKGFSRFSFARVFALSALIAAVSTYENARRGGRRARNTPIFAHATSGSKSVAGGWHSRR